MTSAVRFRRLSRVIPSGSATPPQGAGMCGAPGVDGEPLLSALNARKFAADDRLPPRLPTGICPLLIVQLMFSRRRLPT